MMKAIPAFAALVIASALIVPTVSQAAQTNSVRVSYADLNLASANGANILERRISKAAKVVCEIEDSREIDLAQATMVCRNLAISDAQPAFNAALLAARNPSVTVVPATMPSSGRSATSMPNGFACSPIHARSFSRVAALTTRRNQVSPM